MAREMIVSEWLINKLSEHENAGPMPAETLLAKSLLGRCKCNREHPYCLVTRVHSRALHVVIHGLSLPLWSPLPKLAHLCYNLPTECHLHPAFPPEYSCSSATWSLRDAPSSIIAPPGQHAAFLFRSTPPKEGLHTRGRSNSKRHGGYLNAGEYLPKGQTLF